MASVPWVSCTFPSNTLICLTSSMKTRSDSRWMGLLRSAFSASSSQLQSRSASPNRAALFADRFMERPDARQQPGRARLVIEFHADGADGAVLAGHYHRLVGLGPVAIWYDMQVTGVEALPAAVAAGGAYSSHLIVEEYLVALAGEHAGPCRGEYRRTIRVQ